MSFHCIFLSIRHNEYELLQDLDVFQEAFSHSFLKKFSYIFIYMYVLLFSTLE